MEIKEYLKKDFKEKINCPRDPKSTEYEPKKTSNLKAPWAIFEKIVPRYFYEHKEELGIKRIYALHNARIDGVIELEDGETVMLECKFLLGWQKSCNARIEFELFRSYYYGKFKDEFNFPKPQKGLIVFGNFNGDWSKISKKYKNGWGFYHENKQLPKSFVKTGIIKAEHIGEGNKMKIVALKDWEGIVG